MDPADAWQMLAAAAAELQAVLVSVETDAAEVAGEKHELPSLFDAAAAGEDELESALSELKAVADTAEVATAVLDDGTARIAEADASLREALGGFTSAATARSASIAFDRAGEEEGAALDAARAALAGVEVTDAAATLAALRAYGVAVEGARASHDAVIAAEEAAAAAARQAETARQADAYQQSRRQTGGSSTPRSGGGTSGGGGGGGGSAWTPPPASDPYNGGGMGWTPRDPCPGCLGGKDPAV
ncbi:hypothetical protein A9Z40_01835 [Microbacterium arborescens]|uniref:Uncharacterized protein n=1 Tax=Microbacterium arborescens TaxID=33883 RepID=A0ABX2WJG0_9MICO|nr:hypothetical protein A9Z40_01835 [Microbacterium arborescens]